jgi:ATP synthase protein I
MPKQPSDEEALARLSRRVDDLQARTSRRRTGFSEGGAGAGYTMVAELVSGVLGGLGLGWLYDQYVGPRPLGIVVGVLLGTGAAVFLVVKTASRMSGQAQKRQPGEAVPFDDEDES